MLSLDHWKEERAAGYKFATEKMHLVADICDKCFLQRWQIPNEVILNNGFSIARYPQGHIAIQKPGGVMGRVLEWVVSLKRPIWKRWRRDDINALHSASGPRARSNKMGHG
ncbi:hypothetical protein BJ875DRAFT_20538 [Amylocarpus encephaloides]|uniref:Uncharacterized protein n=1 Tax=Amylocarpus encephaloides TaxID=45428 RepID=A0A9P7YIP6_9HELO|nr:hypothetical protein BJ875DRAFT_20538 [Amylocarpus encephaloides]